MSLVEVRLMRHAVTVANRGEIDPQKVCDAGIELSMPLAAEQARQAGRILGAEYLQSALLYRSPFKRTRQTLDLAIEGAGLQPNSLRIYEDPDLREVDHGYENIDAQEERRRRYGYFWYRFNGGESPSDCHTRLGLFLGSLHRQVESTQATRALICTHGLTARCLVMRWLHLAPEEFDSLANPWNCDIITIGLAERMTKPQIVRGRWGVSGLRFRNGDDVASMDARGGTPPDQ